MSTINNNNKSPVDVKIGKEQKNNFKPLTPSDVRRRIGELDQRIFFVQNAYNRETRIDKRNQLIDLLRMMNDKSRELYFILKHMEINGEKDKEIEKKRLEAWNKFIKECKVAGHCQHNKPAVSDFCYEIGCESLLIKQPEPEKIHVETPMLESMTDEEVEKLLKEKATQSKNDILKKAEEHICPECKENSEK